MISWSVSNLQFPLGKFFLVKPANDTLSILNIIAEMFKIERTTFTFADLNFRPISLLASFYIANVLYKNTVSV
jgi:hypothetical protein